jgi:hypothetical protein
MASPNSTFTELVSTTFRKHRKEIKDNVSRNNALLRRLYDKGNYRKEDGGLTIVTPLDYAANGTYLRYSDWDVLNIAASDVISAAEYQWRQIAMNVVASGRDLRINSGESRIINLVKSRMKNAIRTFKNNFSVDMYSDGTLTNQVNGLQALIADAGTGTVGGINSSNFAFWQNIVQSAAAPLQGGSAITVGASTIESLMLPLWLQLTRGDDKPDLIVMANDYFTFYEQSQVALKLYSSAKEAQGGFISLKYKTADVIFDGGSGITAAHAYFINSDYLELVVHRDADLEIVDDIRPVNQDGAVTPILWMGNLTCSNRFLQGVMKA